LGPTAYKQVFSLENIVSYSTRSTNDGTTVPKRVACKIVQKKYCDYT